MLFITIVSGNIFRDEYMKMMPTTAAKKVD
jgi:hypothetical protein